MTRTSLKVWWFEVFDCVRRLSLSHNITAWQEATLAIALAKHACLKIAIVASAAISPRASIVLHPIHFDPPTDAPRTFFRHFRLLLFPELSFVQAHTPDNRLYFYNIVTKRTKWSLDVDEMDLIVSELTVSFHDKEGYMWKRRPRGSE